MFIRNGFIRAGKNKADITKRPACYLRDRAQAVLVYIYSFIICKYSNSLKTRLITMATNVASTMPCTAKAPKESLAPDRPMIMITEVMTRLEDLL